MATIQQIARAGGGQNYTSGGSSSSSSSTGSYSSSGGTYGGSFSIGSFVVLIIIVVIVYLVRKKIQSGLNKISSNSDVSSAIGQIIGGGITRAVSTTDLTAKLDSLKQADPGFNEQIFKDKAQNAFFKIQEAWEKQDLQIARPFVSDPIIQRYATQIADLKSRGEKNVLENIVIGNIEIIDVTSDNSFNYIKTKIDASCADYTVNAEGKMISGSKAPNGFSEYWTFIRTVGSKTDVNKQLKDNKCPNCGAPLEVNATGQCNYCKAVVSSGQYDWVLSEIDQV